VLREHLRLDRLHHAARRAAYCVLRTKKWSPKNVCPWNAAWVRARQPARCSSGVGEHDRITAGEDHLADFGCAPRCNGMLAAGAVIAIIAFVSTRP
jgi:hypothetical protein